MTFFEVKTVKPYPSECEPTTEIVKDELEKGVIRELQPLEVDLTKYEVIALGTAYLVAPCRHAASNLD